MNQDKKGSSNRKKEAQNLPAIAGEFAHDQLEKIKARIPAGLQKKVPHPAWLVGGLAFAGTVILFLFTYSPPQPGRGKWLYQAHCSACHGIKGRGEGRASEALYFKAKDFRTLDRSVFEDITRIEKVIVEGIPDNVMPGFPDFSEEDKRKLAEYVRRLSKERLP